MRQLVMAGYNALYGYDAKEERVAWADSAEPGIHYSLRGLNKGILREVHELNGIWSWRKDYVFAGGTHLATADSAGLKHVHKDHLGSTRLVTSATGSIISQDRYWPFGEEMTATSSPERMRFAGHERDSLSSLDYMHARYYAPFGGRFPSVDPGRDFDPSHPQSWNAYAYVRDNPVTRVDRDGRIAVPAVYWSGALLVGTATAYLAAPSPTHPGKTNAQVMGESLASLTRLFARSGPVRPRMDPGLRELQRQKDLRARQKSDRKFGPQWGRGNKPLPPGAPGPHTEVGERPHLQNAPSEVDIWTVLAAAELARQVLINSVVYQWKTWVSPAEGETKLDRKEYQDQRKVLVNVTSETNPVTQEEQANK